MVTKQILSFKEVLKELVRKFRFCDNVESYFFVKMPKKNYDLVLRINYSLNGIDGNKVLNYLLVNIELTELIFSDLDKLGYELDSAYNEFQNLIASHTEIVQ